MASRVCLTCKRRFTPSAEHPKRSRCDDCFTSHGQEQWRERIADPLEQALRKFRRSREWQKAQRAAVARDGHRCRGQWHGVRCSKTEGLSVHHLTPARVLIQEGRDPCDLALLVTLCRKCHAEAEKSA